ncbi:MAG: YqjF family protein [Limisphaerales bacterium]
MMESDKGAEIHVRIETVTTTVIESGIPQPPSLEARKALQQEPAGTPVMYQTWRDLLFLHWEWDPAEIQSILPPGLFVDTHGDKAYVAVTPFFMNDVRASFLPEIPGTANFLELNVRTYVYDRNGVPGIWFYSLDCNQSLAVMMAKAFYSLPYYTAEMAAKVEAGLYQYRCHRLGEREAATFHYRKEEKTVGSQPGSLPFFLAERYLLYSYSAKSGKLYSARVHHAPWALSQAHLGKFDETMLRINNLNPKLRPPDHCWMASPVRVKIYALGEV